MKTLFIKNITLLFLLLNFASNTWAQETCIIQENFQIDEATEQLIIPYEILRNGKIQFQLEIENRYGIVIENIKSCTYYKDKGGLVHNVKKGNGTFVWDYAKDGYSLKEIENPNNIRLTAELITGGGGGSGNVPLELIAGGVGLAATVGGLVIDRQGRNLYADYSTNHKDPDDPFYVGRGQTRQQVFDEANSKHQTGTVIMVAGGAILATGITLYLMKKKRQSSSNLSLYPQWSPNFSKKTKNKGDIGIGLTLQF